VIAVLDAVGPETLQKGQTTATLMPLPRLRAVFLGGSEDRESCVGEFSNAREVE
jgi:hypothetical protein